MLCLSDIAGADGCCPQDVPEGVWWRERQDVPDLWGGQV